MSENDFDIDHIASLARLKLADEEKARLKYHLNKILNYVEQLNRLTTEGIEPTSHVIKIQNVFREDVEINKFDNSETILRSAPRHSKSHYEVPQIIG